MTRQSMLQVKKESQPLQTGSLFRRQAAQVPVEEHDIAPLPVGFGRDYSHIPFRPPQPPPPMASVSCPFSPQRCPFGGACHACPPKMQAKLKIGQPGDRYEQEADRVAEQVMRMPEPQVQRKCSAPGCRDEDDEKKLLQTKPASAGETGAQVDHPLIQSVLASPGQPLDAATRSFMEPRFGQDFSGVRVHLGGEAAESARAVNARAYTVGRDVVFGEGQYAPGSDEGKRLVAHELVHVVQADAAAANSVLASSSVAALEREARHAAHAVVSGNAVMPVLGAARGLIVPLREDMDDPGVPTFGNLPQEEPDRVGMRQRVPLVEKNGRWYEKRSDGQLWRARGNYDFVVQGGRIWAVKDSNRIGGPNPGHTEAAAGGRVEYAGMIRFASSPTGRGKVQQWSNASGHYAPVSSFAGAAGLPMDKFVPVRDGFPDKGPQLPVFQPKPGDTFTPRSDAKPVQGTNVPPVGQVTPEPKKSFVKPPAAATEETAPAAASPAPVPADVEPKKSSVKPPAAATEETAPAAASPAPVPADVEPKKSSVKPPAVVIEETTPAAASPPPVPADVEPKKSSVKPPAVVIEETTPVHSKKPVTTATEHSSSAPIPHSRQTDVLSSHVNLNDDKKSSSVKSTGSSKVTAGATKALGVLGTGLGAIQDYQQNVKEGKSSTDAAIKASINLAANVKGGTIGTVVNLKNSYDANIKSGQQPGEAMASSVGSVVAGEVIPTGPAGTAINVLNTGLAVVGAPEEITNVTRTVADVIPSNFAGEALSTTARATYNVMRGDMKAVDKQVAEMQEGRSGAALQGYALLTDIVADTASGKDIETTIMKVGSKGQDTPVAKIGNYLGDQSYQFINKDLPEAAEFAKKDAQRVANAAKKKYEAAATGLQHSFNSVKETVRAKVNVSQEKVSAAKEEAKEFVHERVAAVKERYEQAVTAINENIKTVEQKYEQTTNAIQGSLSAAKEKVAKYLPSWL